MSSHLGTTINAGHQSGAFDVHLGRTASIAVVNRFSGAFYNGHAVRWDLARVAALVIGIGILIVWLLSLGAAALVRTLV